jgi:hypothetical protein
MKLLRDERGRFSKRSSGERSTSKETLKRKASKSKELVKRKLEEELLKRKPAKSSAKAPVRGKSANELPTRKPAKASPKPTKRKPAKESSKPTKRKPAKEPPKPAKRKSAKEPPKPAKEPRKRKRRRRRPELPHLPERSRQAESLMQERLFALFDGIAAEGAGLVMGVQTFINADGTVDGELRVEGLPDDWRAPGAHTLIVEFLSRVFRYFEVFPSRPKMGGAFWLSFGVRFGPQNESEIGELEELYKRHRGLFQVGTYPCPAWGAGAIQNVLTDFKVGLRAMLEGLMEKRGMPPTVILIRFIWTTDDKRPAHYQGEK